MSDKEKKAKQDFEKRVTQDNPAYIINGKGKLKEDMSDYEKKWFEEMKRKSGNKEGE